MPGLASLRSRLHVITHLWIELTRRLSLLSRPGETRFGVEIADHLITMTVYLGMVEEREMTASRIAKEVGLPRTTVLRRLAALERLGDIERRGLTWRTPLHKLTQMERADLDAIAALIRGHADELERMSASTKE
ncbi:helix-turn-helix domain-containing protein [Bradyrhizobium sp. STM 3557]|uniref:helix-turn-helix domain-containing protein n=1 Tax=Bradyrhizobium sp. STM 3557 TaxID=578920 RepID=UPI00388F5D82